MRAAAADDLEAVARLAASEEAAHWDVSAFRGYLEEDKDGFLHKAFFVAVSAEHVVGFVVATWVLGDSHGELLNLAVAREARRNGVARALCFAVGDWIGELGARELDLEVRVSNLGAIALYEGLGFAGYGVRANYYQHPVEDALLMRWQVSG